jgi:hypothetical protein
MENSYQVGFDMLNLKILLKIMFNMNMFFNFATIVVTNHMFKV